MIPLICCQRTANGFPCSQGFSRSLLLPITSITLRTDEYNFKIYSSFSWGPCSFTNHFIFCLVCINNNTWETKLNWSQHITLMFKWKVYRCSSYSDIRGCHSKECTLPWNWHVWHVARETCRKTSPCPISFFAVWASWHVLCCFAA